MIMDYVIALTLVSLTIWLFIISAYLCFKKLKTEERCKTPIERKHIDFIVAVLLRKAMDLDTGKVDPHMFSNIITEFLRDEGVL